MKDKCTCTSTISVALLAIGTSMFISSAASAQQSVGAKLTTSQRPQTDKAMQLRLENLQRLAAWQGGGIAGASNCCFANGGLGCDDPTCQAAVCAADAFCCDTAWDQLCADQAATLCADLCSGGGGGSNCCIPNGGLGCDDPECQAAVCAADAFCCETAWDQLCADAAATLCADICEGGGGGACPNPDHDCNVTGTPGCSDEACCNIVCNADAFCCDTAWDQLCVDQAAVLCNAKPIVNDNCVDRIEVFDGSTDFNNIGATTDGPAHATCLFFGDDQVGSDVWFNYTALETGSIDFSLCGSGFDTKIAVYDGCACPVGDANLLACNDDFCGLQSQATVSVVAGSCYKIRIGGFGGAQGVGTLFIGSCDIVCPKGASQENEACGSDTNGGCNSTPPVYGTLACGETVCGNGWAAGGTRDTDWYTFEHAGGPVSLSVVSQFSAVVFILNDNCASIQLLAQGTGLCPIVAAADLPAGTYRAFVAPSVFDGIPCGGGNNDYVATLSCVTPAPPCIGDTDGNGVVNVEDLLNVINAWGDCPK